MKPWKILSLDGGGCRSVIQCTLLDKLGYGQSLKIADQIAGTSGGAIVGAGLAKGLSPSTMQEFFLSMGPKIFKEECFLKDMGQLWNVSSAKYSSKDLRRELKSIFKDDRLSDYKTPILITSFNLRSADGYWQPKIWTNIKGPYYSGDMLTVDALLASTAAPVYFPVFAGPGGHYIDGGVFANAPSMAGVAAAMDRNSLNKNCSELACLSLGTGRVPTRKKSPKLDMGPLDWFQQDAMIIDVLLDCNSEASHYYTRSLLGPAYERLQPNLPYEIKLDDAASMQALIAIAEAVDLSSTEGFLKGFWI